MTASTEPRWTRQAVLELYDLPFNDLLFRAMTVHREHHDANSVEVAALLSVQTGGCPEDCAYCPQSVHHDTGVDTHALMDVDEVLAAAGNAKAQGATRFCMGAAWRSPTKRQIENMAEMIEAVGATGMETCVTLGMLTREQSDRLAEAGLDYYNHNIDTSPEYYSKIITTRTFSDRLETLSNLRASGIKLCSGGIIGMGETREDRAAMIAELASMPEPPESVPINRLVRVPGTPLAEEPELDIFEFVRTIAVARITMPTSVVRLSAGRNDMSPEAQALCLLAGAGSIFGGDKLLTTPNPDASEDSAMFSTLGVTPKAAAET